MSEETVPEMMQRTEYIPANHSVNDMFDWCVERGLDPSQVRMTGGGHLKYVSPITEEEKAVKERFQREQQRRQEEWERETYKRLKEKYGE